jgi:hypothetical protein
MQRTMDGCVPKGLQHIPRHPLTCCSALSSICSWIFSTLAAMLTVAALFKRKLGLPKWTGVPCCVRLTNLVDVALRIIAGQD